MSARRTVSLTVVVLAVAILVGLRARPVAAASSDPWSWGGTCYMNNCLGAEDVCFSYKRDELHTVLCLRNP